MPYNVLILPLLGGYFFLTYWNFTKFDTKRHSGYRLLLNAAAWGVVFLIIAFCLARVLWHLLPEWVIWWHRVVPFAYAGTSLLAFLLGATIWWPLNYFFFPVERAAERTISNWNDFLEILLTRAAQEIKLVSVSLKSRKVYIGFVTGTIDPMYERKYIQLLPVKSGYRDSATLALSLTVDYSLAYAKIIQRVSTAITEGIQDFEIILPLSEVQSVNLFDPATYLLFNPPTTPV